MGIEPALLPGLEARTSHCPMSWGVHILMKQRSPNSGPGEPHGVLVSIVTQHIIGQLEVVS